MTMVEDVQSTDTGKAEYSLVEVDRRTRIRRAIWLVFWLLVAIVFTAIQSCSAGEAGLAFMLAIYYLWYSFPKLVNKYELRVVRTDRRHEAYLLVAVVLSTYLLAFVLLALWRPTYWPEHVRRGVAWWFKPLAELLDMIGIPTWMSA